MPEKVTIPIAFFEYTARYVKPNFQALMDRARIVQAIYDSLIPWQIKIDDVEPITTGKPSEQGINFRLPDRKVLFYFGVESCKFTKNDADWAGAEDLIKIMSASFKALKQTAGVDFLNQQASVAMHVQPTKMRFVELLKPFLSPAIQALESTEMTSGAAIIKWDKHRIVLDGSAALANALFLKFEREFEGDETLENMALRLRSDEDAILKMLGVEEA
ncbi:MAG TPA: hypothetical protein VGS10_16550 [Terracidiphilus sp.]|nr:hypothetical protein [Terracidiphilus sp.]